MSAPSPDLETLLDEVFASTPLFFVREFLRAHKERSKRVRIGVTRKEVTANLRDAVLSKSIALADLKEWLHAVGGWGKQHLYLASVTKRGLTHPHLLNNAALTAFLTRRHLLAEPAAGSEPASPHVLGEVRVDDELARVTWRSHGIEYERHEELDEHRELDDGEYEFRAYRLLPRRSAARFIIRKTDGIVLTMVDMPLGEDHDAVRRRIDEAARVVLAPLVPAQVQLSQIVSALDEGAMARSGPRPRRSVALGVAPTQAKYRAEGAQLEFRSTRASAGYTESDPVRRVRRAMQIENFQGETGKFRLTFEGPQHTQHDMIVSLHSFDNRLFLFSRMSEPEVLELVDQLIAIG